MEIDFDEFTRRRRYMRMYGDLLGGYSDDKYKEWNDLDIETKTV
jgi:hypothetical protein